MKKIEKIILFLIIFIVPFIMNTGVVDAKILQYGDVNEDGVIDSTDVDLINSSRSSFKPVQTELSSSTLIYKILTNDTVKTNPNFTSSSTDKGLYVQKGDSTKSINGKSTYYYRGQVTNNYVKFANRIWRIVRINEDGTIKLVSNDRINQKPYDSEDRNFGKYSGSSIETYLNDWYETNLSNYAGIETSGKFCNDIETSSEDTHIKTIRH